MTSFNTYKTLSEIDIDGKKYLYFDLSKIADQFNIDIKKIPICIKILLENLLRNEDNISVDSKMIKNFCNNISRKTEDIEIFFHPTRVLMQDFTGVPAIADLASMRDALKKKNLDPNIINPVTRVDLIIDHSVMVDHYKGKNSYEENVEKEFQRNKERYEFLKWGQYTFDNFYLVPPGAGICHQVNLENISKTVWSKKINGDNYLFPDSVVGTDSHTTMINALSVLGWGVGGIEAEATMLGQPISTIFPEVIGFNINGILEEGITATDLVLTITEKLRSKGVVGKFVEFYGSGLKNLTLADRATISNMSPEFGATCSFFPTDNETINYLKLSGKSDHQLKVVESYSKVQKMWHDDSQIVKYDDVIELDLNSVKASVAGPKRPQDKIFLPNVPKSFNSFFSCTKQIRKKDHDMVSGDIAIAAITSCTNTSNPNVMIAAGIVAKKAVELGLTVKPWVKTSLAPGSKVVSDYLEKSGLSFFLNKIGFNLVGYGCTTCIGNSGPLENWVSEEIKSKKLVACSVLSGNRNFEGRIHQEIKANYLASPPLVVAFALAGSILVNLEKEPIGINQQGNKIFLKDIWPSSKDIEKILKDSLSKDMFISRYKEIYDGDKNWQSIKTKKQSTYDWSSTSTYIKKPPFFNLENSNEDLDEFIDARILVMLGDSITTDHISPAGAISEKSPAGSYLLDRQVDKKNFNSYGSRRGNHEVMKRGTFANIRIRNEIIPETEGGLTYSYISKRKLPIYDAAVEYSKDKIPLIVIAGKEYGSGSSRDWAAKGVRSLGVRVVIAESFERIHRSNLIGMGVLPLQFMEGQSRKSLKLNGSEKITFTNLKKLQPNKIVKCKITGNAISKDFSTDLLCRIDTKTELEYFKTGGILQYVLNSIVKKAP